MRAIKKDSSTICLVGSPSFMISRYVTNENLFNALLYWLMYLARRVLTASFGVGTNAFSRISDRSFTTRALKDINADCRLILCSRTLWKNLSKLYEVCSKKFRDLQMLPLNEPSISVSRWATDSLKNSSTSSPL